MTPFKQPSLGRRFLATQDLDFMDAESESLDSPPSPSRASLRQSTRNRLFEDDHCNTFSFNTQQEDDRKCGKTPLRGGGGGKLKVKPLNLSFDDNDSSDDDDDDSALGFQRRKRLEKLAESGRRDGQSHTPTRRYGGAGSSNDSMVSSPYISPSSYILTMDGRRVESKNPFSPMATEETRAATAAAGVDSKFLPAPSLPISLEGGPTSRLQKRHVPSPSKRYASFTRDGYPERSGRYSFTGSPIKENEAKQLEVSYYNPSPSVMAAHKIRRLGLNDDVHYPSSGRQKMAVDTAGLSKQSVFEEVSPTDVFSFPAEPPTPHKTKSPTSGPETPFISRSARRPTRRRGADIDGSDIESITSCTSYQSDNDPTVATTVSRFKSDFDVIGELGKGSFGAVYKVLSRLDGCMYAVKAALRKAKGVADRDRMLKEVYALAALSDQADPATFHIVRYHQAFMEEERLYIQTELCSSNLSDEIAVSRGRLSNDRRYKLLREMLLALEFIHRNDMCHLDIKPQNIFVKKDPPLDVFKLGDFGLVTKIHFHKDVEEGDSRYMSMELLSGDHGDLTKSDIFSLGCTLYEVSLGRELPMNGLEWQEIRAGRLQHIKDTPIEMEMIIREMMNPAFANRPTASDLLKRPQLLSKEQAKLALARQEVFQAKQALAQQATLNPPPPAAGILVRRNTWSGKSFKFF